ncbi:hypothetical protein F443_20707 [Phytophthora nicotianae P1569]|uniref:Uncharacterized protein n=1 Tax=Phytophthora nicotianae P1569 TaxID=1317065 RepID=V9E083_PHYNI|nr:hypothetical protein F443_20707 [Phytophthora nicotianae P1569]
MAGIPLKKCGVLVHEELDLDFKLATKGGPLVLWHAPRWVGLLPEEGNFAWLWRMYGAQTSKQSQRRDRCQFWRGNLIVYVNQNITSISTF